MADESEVFKTKLYNLNQNDFHDERVCSCCLTGGRLLDMADIIKCNERIESYLDLINRCFNSKILIPNELPVEHQICNACVERLTEAYKFKRQIIDAQKALLDYFNDDANTSNHEKYSMEDKHNELKKYPDIKRDLDEFELDHSFDDNLDLSDYEMQDDPKLDTDFNPNRPNKREKYALQSKKASKHLTNNAKPKVGLRTKNVLKKDPDIKQARKPYIKCEDKKVYAAMDKDNILCKVCSKKFRSLHNLSQHMNEHFVNYTCEVCGKGLATSTRFMNHMRRHVTGIFKCRICEKTFDTISRLDNHRAKHRSGKHLCRQCGKRFLSFYSLKKHLIKEHGEDANYPCKFCSVVCLTSGLLVVHVRQKHTIRERNFGCEHCDKEFFEKRALKKHMVVHSGERNYACTECSKAYARKETLTQHMKVHLNIRDYVCSFCGQAFVQKCSLDWHLRKHGYGAVNEQKSQNNKEK